MNKNKKIFSFDVYDTCISRTYEKPADLFYQLGTMIAPQTKDSISLDKFSMEFASARMRAEKIACRLHGRRRS